MQLSAISLALTRVYGGSAAFTPAKLFANSEVGAWYDPSDLSTMFQDRAGTTPVTADGQTVGLILDKSKGLALGPEIIASPYSGSVGGLWTIDSAGVHRNGSTSSNALVTLNLVPSVGWHRISFVVSNFSGDSFTLNYPGGNIGQISANGTYERIVYVTTSASTFSFIPWGGSAGQADISSISYKTLSGNHATAPSDAARPLYKTDGTYRWLQFDGVDDSLSTAAIDFTGTSKISVFGGYHKDDDTNARGIVGLSTTMVVGGFYVWADSSAVGPYAGWSISVQSSAGGGNTNVISPAIYPAPETAVITGLFDTVTGTNNKLRRNGTQVAVSAVDVPDGVFSNNSLYISGYPSNRHKGKIYSIIVRGALSTADEITNTETWVNSKTGAF